MAFDKEIPAPIYEAVLNVLRTVNECEGRCVGGVTVVLFPDGTCGIIPIIDAAATIGGASGTDMDPVHAMLEHTFRAMVEHMTEVRAFEAARRKEKKL